MSPPAATQPTADRTAFMARIRAALRRTAGAAPAPPPPPTVPDAVVRRTHVTDDLVATFLANARACGMSSHRTTRASASALIADLLQSRGVRRIALGPSLDQDLHRQLSSRGMLVIDWSADPTLGPLFDAEAGITDAAGIAETGTLVCSSALGHGRGLSLVPPLHIAIVSAARIMPDLLDALRAAGPLPSSTTLITGPSKTADIEGILITGVHGPREVHAVVLEDS